MIEKGSTTGIGMGIAIPHGKSAYVHKPTVAFARSQDGVRVAFFRWKTCTYDLL